MKREEPALNAKAKSAVLDLHDGKSISYYSWEIWARLEVTGFIRGEQMDAELTDLGKELGIFLSKKRQETRDSRKKSARARTEVMQSLGLVRTRGGQWE